MENISIKRKARMEGGQKKKPKMIGIERDLHDKLRAYCAKNNMVLKYFAEAALQTAMETGVLLETSFRQPEE